MKVFVYEKFGRKIGVLRDDGGVTAVTRERIAPEILDYLETYLPPLTDKEAADVLENFSIRV